ncbi:MAG TPA: hypothetical protein VFX58_17005 [Chitinophagaceae bacterium]|nr:hypothetical protein [Chitinophagaceae bacterium]
MRSTIQYISSVSFLLLGLLPWAFIFLFHIRENQIQHRMKERLEEKIAFHTISLADHEINWVKEGKEIWVQGKMFDIKTMRTHNGITTFTGLFDHEETVLKKQWQAGWQKQTAQDTQSLSRFFSFLLYYPASPDAGWPGGEITRTLSFMITSKLIHPYNLIPTPPPRHFLFSC